MHYEYGIYNPKTGVVERVNNITDAQNLFVDKAMEFILDYFHNTPWVTVRVNDDGTETWNAMNGEFVVSQEQNIKELKDLFRSRVTETIPMFTQEAEDKPKVEGPKIVGA